MEEVVGKVGVNGIAVDEVRGGTVPRKCDRPRDLARDLAVVLLDRPKSSSSLLLF